MKTPRETREVLEKLETQHPGADTELHYTTAFELLTATILSAQSTDAGVNMVTPALFKRYPDARALASATNEELEPQIHSTGFFRAKSKSLIGMAQALVERYGGEVPRTLDELVELPGVGRKTANVVLGHALGVPGLPVDRHVLRVANRIGVADGDDPVAVEKQLCDALPPERWTRTSDTLILHGRRICRPKPLCDECVIRDDCDYFATVVSRERDDDGVASKSKAKRGPGAGDDQPVAHRRTKAGTTSRTGLKRKAGARKPNRKPKAAGRTPTAAAKRIPRGTKRVRTPRR